eukprot:CAMPEP_0197459806 /NCGR_PEP_ID=MMETSP1175-20131217/52430_1 /TAXON_ID=1003142 /ORGANISM="Triceratium dubium, Strain CCMP147" /LENGTH=57 /DNA_ID=CAMNT_0042994775 /DNA_START=73 /DNA_END=243 /DNA_ORIENTATION=-
MKGADNIAALPPPPLDVLTATSKEAVSFRNRAALRALPTAMSYDAGKASGWRRTTRG